MLAFDGIVWYNKIVYDYERLCFERTVLFHKWTRKREINIKDLEKKIGKFYTVLLNNDEHFVLAYDSDDYNRYLEPHVSYLNDFNTYKKERDRYKDDFDLLNSDFDYFIDLFGTDIEEINRFESEALEQDYTDNKFYKSLISSIFRTYKRCLEMKDKLDIYHKVFSEVKEKYPQYNWIR